MKSKHQTTSSSNKLNLLVLAITVGTLPFSQLKAVTIFDANFDNSPFATASSQSAVTAVADLGTPTVGTWSFSSSPVGRIAVDNTGTDKALAVGSNIGKGITNMTEMVDTGVTFGTLPDTQIADSGAGDVVKAVFSQPGKFSFAGEQTQIKFDWGSFGSKDSGDFKYCFVTGYDSSGHQVFELLFQAGFTAVDRSVFARSATDASTTVFTPNSGTPQGTAVLTAIPDGDVNSIGLEPNDLLGVTITLTNNQVTYGFERGTLSSTLTFNLNSAATNMTELRWSAIWNASRPNENKGYWLDDVNVNFTSTNSPPVLTAISNRTLIAGQVLNVTNSASDPDVPPQALTWSVQPMMAGLSISPNTGVLQWRPTIAQSPTTNTLSVIVADNGSPSLNVTQQFMVTVLRPVAPQLSAPQISAGNFGLTIAGDAGPDYTLMGSTNLTSWTSLLTTNPTVLPFTVQLPVSNNVPQQFYRVQLGP